MPVSTLRPSTPAHARLGDQVAALLGLAPAQMTHSGMRPWSSIRFAGSRHEFVFTSDTALAADAAHRLRAHDFALDGEIVADASLSAWPEGYRVEALTVEAR